MEEGGRGWTGQSEGGKGWGEQNLVIIAWANYESKGISQVKTGMHGITIGVTNNSSINFIFRKFHNPFNTLLGVQKLGKYIMEPSRA